MQDRNNQQERTDRGKPADRSSRRKLLKAGALLVPAIVTLHARSASAQPPTTLNRNYVNKGYVYGTEQGKNTFDLVEEYYGAGGTWDPARDTVYPAGTPYTYTIGGHVYSFTMN